MSLLKFLDGNFLKTKPICLVFGVDLDVLLRREANGDDVPADIVPAVLELCLTEIENRGLSEQGICGS